MSDKVGLRSFGNDQGQVFLGRDFSTGSDHSDATAALIDQEIHLLIDEAYTSAKSILLANIGKLHFIAEYLLAHEDMDGDQFKAVMENEFVTVEMIEAIAAEKEKASREANEKKKAAEEQKKAAEAEQSADEDGGDGDDANKNPFDYSPENHGGENPFDYNKKD